MIAVSTGNGDKRDRRTYFGPQIGWLTVPVVSRAMLSAQPAHGPMIIEEYYSSTVVIPDWSAAIDDYQDIVLARLASQSGAPKAGQVA